MVNKSHKLLNLSVVSMTDKHIQQVFEIELECFGEDAWTHGLFYSELSQPNRHYFVAAIDNEMAGYGGYAQIFDEAHIMNVAVRGRYRKKGIAMAIIEKIFDDAKKRNVRAMTLEVRQDNTNAINLYQKCGFILAGMRKNYYRNRYNALIYWKNF